MISIITATYNDFNELKRTIQSVREQVVDDYEHIIVNGGNDKETENLLIDIRDEKVIIISEPDNGVYDAINKGIKKAVYDYILVLNAGDCFVDNDVISNIHKLILTKKEPNYIVGRVKYKYANGCEKDDNIKLPFLINLECSHQAFVYKRELHSHLGYYDCKYKSASDYDFFSRVKTFDSNLVEKDDLFIAYREKLGSDMSDSVYHTIEMMRIDYYYGFLKRTICKRIIDVIKKVIKKVIC